MENNLIINFSDENCKRNNIEYYFEEALAVLLFYNKNVIK